jgi:hypothetical protein
MLSAPLWRAITCYLPWQNIHDLFHIVLVISPRLISSVGLKPLGPISRSRADNKGNSCFERKRESYYSWPTLLTVSVPSKRVVQNNFDTPVFYCVYVNVVNSGDDNYRLIHVLFQIANTGHTDKLNLTGKCFIITYFIAITPNLHV